MKAVSDSQSPDGDTIQENEDEIMIEDVCDQLEVTDEPAEVKIFTEEVLEAAANEGDQDPLNII